MRPPDYPQPSPDASRDVDRYFASTVLGHDPFADFLVANAKAGLVPHDVSTVQAAFLSLLAASAKRGAGRALEIGTLGGYSTAWIAQGLGKTGHVDTLENDPHCASIAGRNIQGAGFQNRISIHVGEASETLGTLSGPYDFIFIDADKPNNPTYLQHALRLSTPGSLIVADNVVRGGAVSDAASTDPKVQGVRQFAQMVGDNPKLQATALQTTGEKGWDGFMLIRVLG